MTERSESALRVLLRSLTPYHDPVRRRRIRRLARKIVGDSPWPGDAASGDDVARLALLRLLWLQQEVHRTSRQKRSEASALLTRSAIETTIVALYGLHAPEAMQQMRDANASGLRAMLAYLPAELFYPPLIKRLVATVGEPKWGPTTKAMAMAVDKQSNDNVLTMLYDAYYAPLSTLYAHGSGLSLLRHVREDAKLQETPASPWFRRSAVHITDSCVALLASVIAKRRSLPSAELDTYYEAHRGRTITPVFVMGGGGIRHAVVWRELPRVARAVAALRSYLGSTKATTQTRAQREATIRPLARDALRFLRVSTSEQEIYELFVEGLVEMLSGEDQPNPTIST